MLISSPLSLDEDLYAKDGLGLAMLGYRFILAGGGFGVHGVSYHL
jgi:hypothetical protein